MYHAEVIEEYRNDDALAEPVGYRLLIAMPQIDDKTEGGVVLPDELKDREQVASIVGCVIAMGKDSYRDKKKFPTGPWCQIGDWVIFRAYSGTKMNLSGGQEIRLINDDTVEGLIKDPRRVVRA